MKAIPLLFGCFMAFFVTTAYSKSPHLKIVVELAEDNALKAISISPYKDLRGITSRDELLDVLSSAKFSLTYPKTILKNRSILASAQKTTDKLYDFQMILLHTKDDLDDTNPPTDMDITKCISLWLADLWHKKEHPFCQGEYPEAFNGFKFKMKTMPSKSVSVIQQYNADQAKTSDYSMDDSDAHTDNMYHNELITSQEKFILHPVTVNYFGGDNTPEIDKTITISYQNIEEESIVEDAFKPTHAKPNLEQPNQEAINNNSMASSQPATSQTGDFLCEQCNLEFPNTHHLITHLKTHTEGKPYKCKYCDKCFRNTSNRDTHTRRHHTGEKPFKCEHVDCNRSFTTRIQMRVHTFSHSDQKLFQCIHCEKSFSFPNGLRRHISKHHSLTPPTLMKLLNKIKFSKKNKIVRDCYQKIKEESIIEDSFKLTHPMANLEQLNQEAINSHSMASGQPATDQKNENICEECGKHYAYPSELKRHSRVHSGEKHFECVPCGKFYPYRYSLTRHHKKHHSSEAPLKGLLHKTEFSKKPPILTIPANF
ncbi:MAG: C2H2-type zinc finger protein [Endozoicomonas sp. (ex Botrylloides leachii)]|nr:C2H2-type zinc finger protein [Endozoicomonas sp. (ex Botrylloides leachii)]